MNHCDVKSVPGSSRLPCAAEAASWLRDAFGLDGYLGKVRVLPITVPATSDKCLVVWTSAWTAEKGGVHEFCDPIYRALLGDMKAHFG